MLSAHFLFVLLAHLVPDIPLAFFSPVFGSPVSHETTQATQLEHRPHGCPAMRLFLPYGYSWIFTLIFILSFSLSWDSTPDPLLSPDDFDYCFPENWTWGLATSLFYVLWIPFSPSPVLFSSVTELSCHNASSLWTSVSISGICWYNFCVPRTVVPT